MMGDKDYRSIIKNAIDSIGKELELEIDHGAISIGGRIIVGPLDQGTVVAGGAEAAVGNRLGGCRGSGLILSIG